VNMIIYDASNQILGRLCSVIAKRLLKGEKISVVNCEKAVLAGNPRFKKDKYKHKYERGDALKGPFFPKQPERILRRTVRGMLPWDRARGRNAYRNLKAYIGVPEELQGKKFEKTKFDASNLNCNFTTLGDVAIAMGAERRW